MTKAQRTDFLASQAVVPHIVEAVHPSGAETTMVIAAGDESRRPAFPDKVVEPLADAIALGLRVLPHPRFHTLALPAAWYAAETEEISLRTVKASAAIENKGVGRRRLHMYTHELSWKYESTAPSWMSRTSQ